VEVLVIIVIVVLVLVVAGGPLLAMRNPAEADKLTPGADPAGSSSKEPDASESTTESPTPRHTEDPCRESVGEGAEGGFQLLGDGSAFA
jgi:hypothetical protein